MTVTYTGNLKLGLPVTGTEIGSWGDIVNQQITNPLDQAVSGTVSLTSMTNADYTLANGNGALTNEARYMALLVPATLTLTAARNIIVPNSSKMYLVINNSTGGFAVTVKTSAGSGVSVPNGTVRILYCDGASVVYAALSGTVTSVGVSGGTTGLTTSGGPITSSGTITLAGTLAVANGGTGITAAGTAGNVLLSNGTAWLSSAISTVPTGVINLWATATAPSGWLLCDGSAVSRTTYATLFALIGATFGSGDGSTTFNVPNYTDRMPIGSGSAYATGATGGSANAVVVSHTHTATSTVTDPGHVHGVQLIGDTAVGSYPMRGTGNLANVFDTNSATTGITVATANTSTGVSGTNANLPPYLGIRFIIKT